MARHRVPFEFLALEIAKSDLCNDVFTAREKYYDLLETFGWSKEDFENKLLSVIDKEWSAIHKETCLSN